MMTPEFLRSRHSVRSFTDEPLSDETVKKLKAEITMINTHEAGMHFELFCNDPAPFQGFTASYGMFKNVRNYIAAVVDVSFRHCFERTGYFAQQLVMKAVELGLGTCYVGGTFDKSKTKVILRADRHLIFIIALGYAAPSAQTTLSSIAMKMLHRHDKSASDLFIPTKEISYSMALEKMPWLENGLRALAAAPSYLNHQPVRIIPKEINEPGGGKKLTVVAVINETNPKTLVDLGIGKYNFAQATGGDWKWGNGEPFFMY